MSKPNAVIYVRVSDKKQLQGNGLKGQEQNCRNYAEQRGYTVIEVFREKGLTGGVLERTAMQDMIAYLKEYKRKTGSELIVIIDELKRWAREVEVHFALKRAISKAGGRLESPGFKFEDTSESRFVETVLAGAAELERNQNREQVYRRMHARLEGGFWVFPAPAGYQFEKHREHKKVLALDPVKAPVVTACLNQFADGTLSRPMDVVRYLDQHGFFTQERYRRLPNKLMFVHGMLRQTLYTGCLEYPSWKIGLRKAYHPALISMATFERIRDRLNDQERPSIQRADSQEQFVLRNVIACAECGRKLTASWCRGRARRYAYYHCYNRACSLYGRTTPEPDMHIHFRNLLQTAQAREETCVLMGQCIRQAWKEQAKQQHIQEQSIPARMREIDTEVRRLVDRLVEVSNRAAITAIEERIAELEREKITHEEKLRVEPASFTHIGTLIEAALQLVSQPVETWETRGFATKRILVTTMFERPPVYIRHRGFGTPDFALLWQVSRTCNDRNLKLVDPSIISWNKLLEWIIDHQHLILALSRTTEGDSAQLCVPSQVSPC